MLFEDTFEVKEVDSGGKKFDKVSRIVAETANNKTKIVLDIASYIYKMNVGDRYNIALYSTLNVDGTPDADEYNPNPKDTIMDSWDYVCHGKLFKVNPPTQNDPHAEVIISYGGLLMSLRGDPRLMQKLELDARVYLLVRGI